MFFIVKEIIADLFFAVPTILRLSIAFNFSKAYLSKLSSCAFIFSKPVSLIKSNAFLKAITPAIFGVPASNL